MDTADGVGEEQEPEGEDPDKIIDLEQGAELEEPQKELQEAEQIGGCMQVVVGQRGVWWWWTLGPHP